MRSIKKNANDKASRKGHLRRQYIYIFAVCWRSFDFHFEQEILMVAGVSYQEEMIYRVAVKEFPVKYV